MIDCTGSRRGFDLRLIFATGIPDKYGRSYKKGNIVLDGREEHVLS